MIKANSKYENELGFTRTDIENFMNKYKFKDDINESNELGYFILWKNKYINNEEFAKLMDLEYKEDNFWLVINSFSEILSDSKYETEIKVLDNNDDDDWFNRSDYYENHDIDSYYWHRYTEKTLQEIIDFCINKNIEIENEDGDYELMTTENTYLKPNKRDKLDIYFKYENGEEVELLSLLDEDELEELKEALNRAICDAQDTADRDEIYDQIIKEFEKSIGFFKREYVKKTDYKGVEKEVDKISIKLDNIDWNKVETFLEEEYEEYDFETKKFGDLLNILKEMEFFEFKTPYYNHIYGDITNELLNEYTIEKLNW
jgi:hypothetical protein